MSLERRNNSKFWYSVFVLQGRRYIKSTKTANKTLASKIDRELYDQAVEQLKLGGNTITFDEAIKLYMKGLEDSSYKTLVNGVLNWIKVNMNTNIPMTQVDTKFLYDFVELRSVECENSTVKYNLGCIKRLIKHIKKLGYGVADVEVPVVKVKNKQIKTLTVEQQERLLQEFSNPSPRQGLGPKVKKDLLEWHDVCVCLFSTGCRVSEILEMKWSQVDLDNKLFYIYRKKTDSNSVLPMSDKAYEILSKRQRIHEYVFPNPTLTSHRRYSSETFAAACKRADLDGITFHKIRHTVITNYCNAGLSLQQTMCLSGHSSINSLMRYNHLTSHDVVDRAREIINK